MRKLVSVLLKISAITLLILLVGCIIIDKTEYNALFINKSVYDIFVASAYEDEVLNFVQINTKDAIMIYFHDIERPFVEFGQAPDSVMIYFKGDSLTCTTFKGIIDSLSQDIRSTNSYTYNKSSKLYEYVITPELQARAVPCLYPWPEHLEAAEVIAYERE